METLDLSPRLSKLFCDLKLEHINEKYKPIEKKYNQIDELFDMPETEERNSGIAVSYSNLYKKAEEFRNTVNNALRQIELCDYDLRIQTFQSALSKKLCKKHLVDKMVDAEWTKDIGTLGSYIEDVRCVHESLKGYNQRVNDLMQRLRVGMSCMKSSLEKEEKTMEEYRWSVDDKTLELVKLAFSGANTKNGPGKDMLQAQAKLLKTSLEKMEYDTDSRKYSLMSLEVWLDFRLNTQKLWQDQTEKKISKKELEKKLKNVRRINEKYFEIKRDIRGVLSSPLLKDQPYLIFKN